jgi:dolichol-phosphate mannosyltransferase
MFEKVIVTGGFEFDMELTIKSHLAGLKIAETPTTWTDRTAGESRFRPRQWLPKYLRWYLHAIAGCWPHGQPRRRR